MSISSIQLSSPLPSPSATPNQPNVDTHRSQTNHISIKTDSSSQTTNIDTENTIYLPPLVINPPQHTSTSIYPLVDTPTPPELKRILFTIDNKKSSLFEEIETYEAFDHSSDHFISPSTTRMYNIPPPSSPHCDNNNNITTQRKRSASTYLDNLRTSTTTNNNNENNNNTDTDTTWSPVRRKRHSDYHQEHNSMIDSEQMDSHIIKSESLDFNSSVSTLNTISTSNMSTSSINATNPGSTANNASSSSSSSILMNSIANQSLVSLLPEFAAHLPTTATTNDMIESNIADSPNSALPSPVSDIDPNEPNWHSATSLDMQTTHSLQHHPSLEMNSSITNTNLGASNPHSDDSNINNITTATTTATTANMMDIVHETDSLTDEDMDGNSTNSSNNNSDGGGINSLLRTYDALPSNIQDYLMFQLLRRSPMASLRFSSDLIMQALRTDFISALPRQLSQHILLYLDAKSLCRAAGVSKYWKKVIDGDSQLWKAKIIEAGFTVTTNEVESYHSSSSLSSLSLAAPIKTEIITPISSSSIPAHFNNSNNNNSEQQSNHPLTTATSSSPTSITSPYLSSIKEMIHDGVYNSFLDKPLFDHSLLSATSENSLSYHHQQQQKMASSNLNDNNDSNSNGNNNLQQHNDFKWQPDFDHLYKKIYRRHHIMRLNWKRNRAEKKQITGSGEVVTCLQFDDDKIITGFDNNNIHIYDIKTGELRRVLKDHEGGVWALQYVGNTLVTGSTDRTLRVWDIERGVCRYVFRGHGSTVRCLYIAMPTPVQVGPGKHDVVIQPSQPLIVSGSRDSFLRVWKLPYLSTRHSQQQKHFQDSSHNAFDRQYNTNSTGNSKKYTNNNKNNNVLYLY